ncbi:hypothetical protein [Lysobacter gummosus]
MIATRSIPLRRNTGINRYVQPCIDNASTPRFVHSLMPIRVLVTRLGLWV